MRTEAVQFRFLRLAVKLKGREQTMKRREGLIVSQTELQIAEINEVNASGLWMKVLSERQF
jgi:hypothetical protein